MKFFPYLLADFPDRDRFSDILDLTLRFADTIEIGIPFTDPVADGPIIAEAAYDVLSRGFVIDSLFELLRDKKSSVPIALMTYANPVLAYGRQEFFKACMQSGVSHVIIPDVPFEESITWRGITKEHRLNWISFISLLTRQERLKQIARSAEGFVYLLSLTGITGAAISRPEQVRNKAKEIKQYTSAPVALGFGIKSAEDSMLFAESVDALIVGSKIIEFIRSNSFDDLERFYRSFRSPEC